MFFHIFILIFMNCVLNCLCFHVSFREFYGAQLEPFNTQMQKREMAQFFDKAAYSFNGLEKIESVPVSFPIDICILSLEGAKYAASLHKNKNGVRHFTVYKSVNQSYHELHTIATPNATAMDCKALGAKGYIALAFNLTQPIENARDGSPIYELTANDRLRAVQFFSAIQLYSIYLRTIANDLFMLQTFRSSGQTTNSRCPYYKWTGKSFTLLARIPCSNARHVEPFAINYENYVALANYADQKGRTTTYSEIYKFVREKRLFQLVQKIRTYGAVDVRYFDAQLDEVKTRHFLVYGNTISNRKSGANGDTNEADSVFYLFDKGQFVPYQSLSLYAVEQFLPVKNVDAEKFLLLVACKDQDTKIYNLNDWKFEPSNVQFTEGALGRGVSKMRIYQENEKSYLVIANDKMTENDTNIFLPIFKQDEHANALRQQIIDWTKTQIGRLTKIDVNKLKNNVEQKLTQNRHTNINMQVQDIPQSNIQTVNTNSFVYPKHQFSSGYWQALSFATQAVNRLEAELRLPTIKRLKRTTADPLQKFANIKVDSLVVKDHLQALQVNGVDATKPTFKRVKAKKIRVTGRYQAAERMPDEEVPMTSVVMPSLVVKHLQIIGNLNEYTWHDLLNHTLKRDGVQFVQQPAHIGSLVAESVRVLSNEIDGNNLQNLIPIDGGNGTAEVRIYVVNQSVLFEEPVKAKALLIHERLNQIQVHQTKLDVLLKRANETQVVEGAKRLENLRILQPITMAVSEGGQTLGKRLQSLSSHQIIHDDLILNGDFTIKGDAIISDFLSADDLIDENSQLSTKQTLLNGLDITQPLEDVNINFEQPLKANKTLLTFINAIDMQQLIKTNYKHLQVLEGEKHFKKTLEIRRGFGEVKYLNDVDTEELVERLLFKSVNQSIQTKMHFGNIQTHSVTAQNLTVKDKPLEAYVTRNGHQHMPITLTVAKLNARAFNIERLYTNGYIFGQSVTYTHNQPFMSKYLDLLQPSQTFPNTIFVGNLRLKDGSVNGRNVHAIEKQLQHLNADIQFEGNYKFNYDMNISQLTFEGKFNDILSVEFGRTWLKKNGTQIFTTPQSFYKVNCQKGVQLDGTLNGRAIDEFYENAYWIHRNEHIDAMEFQNPIQMQAPLSTTTLNGVHIPLDIISANSSAAQILYASVLIHGDLSILGADSIYNVSTLNGVHLLELQQLLKTGGGDTLHVEHANFTQAPLYRTLNHRELSTLLNSVWLANENVRLSQHIELADATFDGLLEFEGLVNNLNLHYLRDNYLSLTRPQEIGSELIMVSETKFVSDLAADKVQLDGLLVESGSNSATNFDEYVANTLKTDGSHEVRASWSMLHALIQGDIEYVEVNNLNLAHDVVRLDVPYASMTAPKRLKTSNVQKLCSASSATINDVPVVDWMQYAIYEHGNQTINGITTLNTVTVNKDLSVLGAVNDIANFCEQTVMLSNLPQTLHGDVHINNLLPKDRRILETFFENLRVKNVNGQQVDKLYRQHAKLSSSTMVEGNLVFLQPLVVQYYHNKAASEAKWKRNSSALAEVASTGIEVTELPSWKTTLAIARKLKKSLEVPYYTLNKFDIRQKLAINATKIVAFRISKDSGHTLDVIGIADETNTTLPVQYYQWSIREEQFQSIQDVAWLPREKALVDMIDLLFGDTNEMFNFAVLNKLAIFHLLSNSKYLDSLLDREQHQAKLTALTISGERCIARHPGQKNNYTHIFCMKNKFEAGKAIYEKFVIPRTDIRELLQVSGDKIVLLLTDSVEIWRAHSSLEFLQRLPISKAIKIVSGELSNVTILAIQFEKESNSIRRGNLEIYSTINSTHFGHMQSLECAEQMQLSFGKVALTGDLLLYILTRKVEEPLTIYQYKGVYGFHKIVGATTLPAMQSFKILHLENATKPMIVLIREGELTFVETVLRNV